MSFKLRPLLLALLVLIFGAASGYAAPNPKITSYQVSDGRLLVTVLKPEGEKQLVAEKSGMTNILANPQALIVGGGYALIYQAPGTASGFEGETNAVKYFDVNGSKRTLLNQGLSVSRIREVETDLGYGLSHKLYVVSMEGGETGIPSLYLVDKQLGVIWKKFGARMSGVRNDKLIIALYSEQSGDKRIGSIYLDLYKLMMQQPGYGFG